MVRSFAYAGIAIGALVPAAVMSIGAANTFTRNVWKPFVDPDIAPRDEAQLAKLVSLVVKVGALVVILAMPTKFAIDLQLLGGVWMVQVFPAVILGLFTRWFSSWALLAGWAVGMGPRHRALGRRDSLGAGARPLGRDQCLQRNHRARRECRRGGRALGAAAEYGTGRDAGGGLRRPARGAGGVRD